MIISQLPELFVQRERALLGPRFDAMFSYPGQGAVRGASVNALRCTPQQFAALADFPLEASPFCPSAFVVPQPDWKPGRHPYHHAGAFYAQEPSASAPAALLDVHPGMRVADLCAAPGGKTSQLAAALAGQGREVVFTGRNPAAWMLEQADYATEMRAEKHPYSKGVAAREGVEF